VITVVPTYANGTFVRTNAVPPHVRCFVFIVINVYVSTFGNARGRRARNCTNKSDKYAEINRTIYGDGGEGDNDDRAVADEFPTVLSHTINTVICFNHSDDYSQTETSYGCKIKLLASSLLNPPRHKHLPFYSIFNTYTSHCHIPPPYHITPPLFRHSFSSHMA